MELFSEVYGAYFRAVARLLSRKSVTENEIYGIVTREAFRDSMLFLPPRLIPQKDGSDWGLLRKNADGTYSPVTKNPPVKPVTELHKRWLRAKLDDPKFRLFLDDDTISLLADKLSDIKPLYRKEHFRFTDKFNDGDNYSDELYRRNFRAVLDGIKSGELIHVEFETAHGQRRSSTYLPLKMEYSPKNDKFRLYCCNVSGGKAVGSGKINIGRIKSVTLTGKMPVEGFSMESFFSQRKCTEPVTVHVSTRRNAVERFMMEFAAYEKHSEYDTETGSCTVKLWYDKADETELLIRLLSFGPAIEILSPSDFREQAAKRIRRQYELLYGDENSAVK